MEWIYAAIIVGSLVYMGAIVVDFLNQSSGMGPKIKRLEEEVVDLNLEANAQVEVLEDVHKRASSLKTLVNDLRRQTSEMRNRLQAEQERKRRLEIAIFRKRLRSREPLATA